MSTHNDLPTGFETRIGFDDAQRRVVELASVREVGLEEIALDLARGRIAAKDIVVPHDLPPFANSAMDGFALRARDLDADAPLSLQLAGTMLAGATQSIACEPGTCIRITTGAPIPPGADTVVMKEDTEVASDRVSFTRGAELGRHVRPAGEDFHRGNVAVKRGDRLTPARLAVLAACGRTHVGVTRTVRVTILVTGDELVAPGVALGFGQIHDSNRYMLRGLLDELGIAAMRAMHVRDEPASLGEALRAAVADSDIVITSGGVSAGEADFMPRLVAELGRVHFWKVRLRPGMPVLCGQIDRALVFALPGNPVSTFATFLAFVVPALNAMQGVRDALPARMKGRLAAALTKSHDRTELMRANIEARDDGALWLTPLAKQGSGMLRGVAEADALVVVSEDARNLQRGSVVEFLPLAPTAWYAR